MIIGLTGHMRSGKDSVAEVLAAQGFHRLAFADTLRSMALAVDPLVAISDIPDLQSATHYAKVIRLSRLVELVGWEEAKRASDVRGFLQRLGTEGVRDHLGHDSWVVALERKMDAQHNYVITDVRFPNEAEAIKAWGGQLWRIERPGFDGDNHASEIHVNALPVNLTIHNTGTLVDLHDTVIGALKRVGAA